MLLVFHSERFFLRQYIKGYPLVIVACFSLISLIHFELILYKEKNISQISFSHRNNAVWPEPFFE